MAQTTKEHADQVQATVARGSAATSAVVASWRRSSNFHRLDPAECSLPRQFEFDLAQPARQAAFGGVEAMKIGRPAPGRDHGGRCGRAARDRRLHLIGMVFGGLRHASFLPRGKVFCMERRAN